MAKKLSKMYYSITEVGEILNLKPHILRYWETEFPILHPKKNRAGNRAYRKKDIEIAKSIKFMLYEEGYTIDGARKKLLQLKEDGADIRKYPKRAKTLAKPNVIEIISVMREVREGLIEMRDLLEHNHNADVR
jgi:DNA-binding transcriptional MerR regulator